MAKKLDEVQFVAIWLYTAAKQAGKVEMVRDIIRQAMKESIDMYGLANFDEPDDPQFIPTMISKFAASWDDFDREERENEAM